MQYSKSEETKRRILETASQLFFKNGYQKTTVREIAQTADVSLSRLNYHFTNKKNVAGVICQTFLNCLNHEISLISRAFSDELILRDSIHIRLWAYIFLSDNACRDFYYELAQENILRENLLESDYRHFKEQATYLQRDISDNVLRAYAHAFVASMIQFIIVLKEDDSALNVPQILNMINELHLKLLGFESEQIESLVNRVIVHTRHIEFEIYDLMTIRLAYRNSSEDRNSF